MVSINGILGLGLQSQSDIQKKNNLTRQVQFAMQRIVQTIQSSSQLIKDTHDMVTVTISQERDLDGNDIPDADNDGDGSIDEDVLGDMNGDGCPGECKDNNFGDTDDDDADGLTDEDWYDAVVFFVNTGFLYQRTSVPWDENGDSTVNKQDYVQSVIAENVNSFTVKLTPPGSNGVQLVSLTLTLTDTTIDETVSLKTQARVGGAL